MIRRMLGIDQQHSTALFTRPNSQIHCVRGILLCQFFVRLPVPKLLRLRNNCHKWHFTFHKQLILFFSWFPSSCLGTHVLQAPACWLTVPREAGASKTAFPSWSSHRYTQVWLYLSEHMNVRQFQRASFTQRRKGAKKIALLCAFASFA